MEETELVIGTRKLIEAGAYAMAGNYIAEGMLESPHSAVPHNLMGMLLEKMGRHVEAMKHFRAAGALDPTYLPARYNIQNFGSCAQKKLGAYLEEDCPLQLEQDAYCTKYDARGIGHIIKKKR